MDRRIRNTLLFVGSALGTALMLFGLMALSFGDREGWTYIVGSVAAFALAFAPGIRLRKKLGPPEA